MDSVSGEPLDQDLLRGGLRDEKYERVGSLGESLVEQRDPRRFCPGVQHDGCGGVARLDEDVGNSVSVQELQGSGLDRQGARLVHGVGRGIDDPERRALRGEFQREAQTGRSRAHHQHVRVG